MRSKTYRFSFNSTRQMMNNNKARNKALQSALILTGTAWFIFGIMSYYLKRYEVAYLEFVFAILNWGLFTFFRLRPSDRLIFRMQVPVALSLVGIFLITNISDHCRSSPIVWFYVIAPLATAMQISIRRGIQWALIALSMGVLNTIIPPLFLIEAFEFSSLEYYAGYTLFFILVLWLALDFRGVNDRIISELKEREADLEDIAQELKFQTQALEVARDEALDAAKIKSLFLANMSHEIRTPLNGVLGMSTVLLDTALSPEQRTFARTISKSGAALLSVINEILDFSKLEAGLVQLETIPFDLYECVDDVLDIFGHEVEQKGLDLAAKFQKGVPRFVSGDLTRVRQVLINLIGNAVKFTENGEVVVTIFNKPTHIEFEIKDTGIGIPFENRDQLFKDFSQVDTSTTRRFGGTGLGLAISRRLVEFMDGEIWFESVPGNGSAFSFFLPLKEVASPMRSQTLERITLTKRTCIIIGAQKTSKDTLEDRVSMWGMHVESVTNFSELMQYLSVTSDLPELAILTEKEDHEIILSSLKKIKQEIKTLMILSVTSTLNQESLTELGIDSAIYRPIRFRQLRQVIEAIFGGWNVDKTASLTLFDPHMASRIPLNILIAEDNPTNLQVALSMFSRLGYDAESVENGEEVLSLLEKKTFDLIFMDIHMPVLDGIETTKKIHNIYGEKSPWIIALSASVLDTQRIEAQKAGMNDFLGKPYEANNLIRTIERFVSKTRLSASQFNSYSSITQTLERDENALRVLQELFPNNSEKFKDLVKQHIQNGSKLYEKIIAAIEQHSYDDLKFAAHSLKSSSAMFGSIAVSEICAKLESAAIDTVDFSSIEHEKTKLEHAWEKAVLFLQNEIK